ncbi:hypothetical protein SAICODRAFT_81093 [Saitoella complicata NRRL Y-17804]|uniref:uncharacterized protein n=1 Tax=Saitoella complicata (strain BCRC 22490 / CBS 7301 / JCM 7358 / NBRC 10748 / NRRL Y-17804) TaxID=698492 RepID=UPI000867329C|nr:uncharacterized protein SAICODRAFT_81093 [Saitoella complicata NRRL Y-17804]ODQ52457.1 hypothetical protein SAICODRAFT_81093 [Saitoella complicata NRRL Y-17804]
MQLTPLCLPMSLIDRTVQVMPSYLVASQQTVISGKPITSMLLLPQISRAVILCNTTLSFHVLPELTPATETRIKGVNGVCLDLNANTNDTSSVTLTVLTRKLLRVIRLSQEDVQLVHDVDYPNALVAAQRGSIACVANARSYDLIDLDNLGKIPLFPVVQGDDLASSPGAATLLAQMTGTTVVKPMVVGIGADEFLVTSASPEGMGPAIGLLVNLDGEVTRGTLMWDEYPIDITFEDPHVVALFKDGSLQVHSINTQELVQTVKAPQLDNATSVRHIAGGYKILSQALADKLAQVRYVQPEDELDEKLSARIWEEIEAVRRISLTTTSLFITTQTSISTLLSAPLFLHVNALLDQKRIEEALVMAEDAIFNMRPEDMNPERLYHEMTFVHQKAAFLYIEETLFEHALALLEKGSVDPRLVGALWPEFGVEKGSVWVYQGVRSVVEDLGTIDDIIRAHMGKEEENNERLKQTLRFNAREMLRKYLQKFREKKGFGSVGSGDEARKAFAMVDRVLLHLLLELDPNVQQDRVALYDFVDSGVDDLDEAVSLLQQGKKYYALSRLYQSRKMVAQVLETWRKMLEGEWADDEFKDGERRLKEYLINQVRNGELWWEYAMWLVKRNPELGVQVLLAPDPKKKFVVEVDVVIEKLRRESRAGLKVYLEHLMFEQGVKNPVYQNDLVALYAEDILTRLENEDIRTQVEYSVSQFRAASRPKPSFIGFLQETVSSIGDQDYKKFVQTRLKLLDFLQADVHYEAQDFFESVQQRESLLPAELVILYGKFGRHVDALRLLCHDLKDFQGAEIYCLHGGLSMSELKRPVRGAEAAKVRRELFTMLLSELLALENRDEQMTQTSDLLEKYCAYFDVADVLRKVPDSWAVDMLAGFLTKSLRRLVQEKREVQMMKSLSRGENHKINALLMRVQTDEKPVIEKLSDEGEENGVDEEDDELR